MLLKARFVCIASNSNLCGVSKMDSESLMLGSLIAWASSTLCMLSSVLHQLLQLQKPNNNFSAQRRSYACFSKSPDICLILWLGKRVGYYLKAALPLQNRNISINVGGHSAWIRTARYRVSFSSHLLRRINSWNCTSKTGVRLDSGPWPLRTS